MGDQPPKVCGASITEVSSWSLEDALNWLMRLQQVLPEESLQLFEPIMNDLPERLKRIIDVGLGYLSLERQAVTLSGGESQRLRLASLLGSGLTGVVEHNFDTTSRALSKYGTSGVLQSVSH